MLSSPSVFMVGAMDANYNDVRFDYDGSLNLARQLWQLAEGLDQYASARSGNAETALTSWLGAYADEFVERANNETTTAASLSAGLRADAQGWAICWASAMNEQNNRLYAREVKRVESNRDVLDKIGGAIFGHDDLPSEPTALPPPSEPYFGETGTFVQY